jgi:Ca2+-binding RTX toxin-like protein
MATIPTKPGSIAASDIIGSNLTDDYLMGTSGNDIIFGAGTFGTAFADDGIDIMQGGAGDDQYIVNNAATGATDTIIEYANEGVDTVFSSVNYTLPSEVENIVASVGAVTLTGNLKDNILDGSQSPTATAVDTLKGMEGNDTYISGTTQDKVIEGKAGTGVLATSPVTYSDPGGIDTIISGTTVDISALITSAGQKDTVVVGVSRTTATDTIVGQAYIENVTLTGATAANITGNDKNNTLTGNSAANTIDGGAGNDILDGGMSAASAAAAVLTAAAATPGVTGAIAGLPQVAALATAVTTLAGAAAGAVVTATGALTLAAALTGVATADAAADDTLIGGLGNDTYIKRAAADTFTETSATGGTDTIISALAVTAPANIENITLNGVNAVNATGNGLANVIKGNSGDNTLTAGAGNDFIYGMQGDDTLDGGLGNDILIGGRGDDTYIVDSTSDKVNELADAVTNGTDLVLSSVTYTLNTTAAVGVENLTLTGTVATNATGNALNNILIGNTGANILNGGVGADDMRGGTGNDTYVVDNAADTVTDTGGTDLVQTSVTFNLLTGNNLSATTQVENITLTGTLAIDATGNALANTMTGNAGANTMDGGALNDKLIGNAGADTLTGGLGNDRITGGAGQDIVKTGDATDTGSATESDTIVFAAGVADTAATATSVAGVDLYSDLLLSSDTNDLIDLTVVVANVGTAVTAATLAEATFVADMALALNQSGSGFDTSVTGDISAAVVTATAGGGGVTAGDKFLAVDLNKNNTFDATDFVIEITGSTFAALDVSTFI